MYVLRSRLSTRSLLFLVFYPCLYMFIWAHGEGVFSFSWCFNWNFDMMNWDCDLIIVLGHPSFLLFNSFRGLMWNQVVDITVIFSWWHPHPSGMKIFVCDMLSIKYKSLGCSISNECIEYTFCRSLCLDTCMFYIGILSLSLICGIIIWLVKRRYFSIAVAEYWPIFVFNKVSGACVNCCHRATRSWRGDGWGR